MADSTYYVNRATGNDINTGEENTPFATIQKALDLVDRGLDLGGQTLTIQIASADYTDEGLLNLPVITGGRPQTSLQIRIVGSGTGTIVTGFELNHDAYYLLESMELLASVVAQNSGIIELKDLYFYGASSSKNAINAVDNGIVHLNSSIYFYDIWRSLFLTSARGQIATSTGQSNELYISQSVNCNYLLEADSNSFIDLSRATFYIDFESRINE